MTLPTVDIEHGEPVAPLIDHVFVYGTLRPGDVRWSFLEPFVTDGGAADSVIGSLFDTGEDYPAATFTPTASSPRPRLGPGAVRP